AKAATGMHPSRRLPRFARRTFQREAARRGTRGGSGPRVVLWPDTFNNHFHPETAMAALEVLEGAGFDVAVPSQRVCCGRPLYDFGMLDRARAYLERTLETMRDEIDRGAFFVVLEPACASVFRDEMPNLLAGNARAERLGKQTVTLGQLLARQGFDPPLRLRRRALVHPHCHQQAVLGTGDEMQLLRGIGLELDVPDAGCCGMAGSFGFEKSKYDVSVACGERVLLPAVRAAAEDTLIVADGFSCREQIAQLTGRHALHLADVLAAAARH
ncbi:MAG TPA: heterodisulfide reductase-related iron-sulfur binding cluster, partial [Usitatibacter sp.]|nr:heterodisulfide reductase-related iron-sulfur binding cluster [Usitatibacter sp.]